MDTTSHSAVRMEEEGSECNAGDIPDREGLPMPAASLLHAWEWTMMLAPSQAAAQGGQKQRIIAQS